MRKPRIFRGFLVFSWVGSKGRKRLSKPALSDHSATSPDTDISDSPLFRLLRKTDVRCCTALLTTAKPSRRKNHSRGSNPPETAPHDDFTPDTTVCQTILLENRVFVKPLLTLGLQIIAKSGVIQTWVARPESAKGVRPPHHALRGLRACHPKMALDEPDPKRGVVQTPRARPQRGKSSFFPR